MSKEQQQTARADDGRRLPFAGKRRLHNVVKVRFPRSHRAVECDAGSLVLDADTTVVVKTRRGQLLGRTVGVRYRKVLPPDTLQTVVRPATERDLARVEANEERARTALVAAVTAARELRLQMKFLSAEVPLDRKRLTFYFSAEGRVDFRQLVRVLAKDLRTRIEMHQVGVRHGAGTLGGLGSCGRELCCSTFLDDFEPVAIRMVKDQGLTLNPKKVSGMCGRLMCCLVYEHSGYVRGRKRLPRRRNVVRTRYGTGRVRNVDVVQESVEVKHDDGSIEVYPLREVILSPSEAQLAALGEEPIPPAVFTIDGLVLEDAEPARKSRRDSGRRGSGRRGRGRGRGRSGRKGGAHGGRAAKGRDSGRKGGGSGRKSGGSGRKGDKPGDGQASGDERGRSRSSRRRRGRGKGGAAEAKLDPSQTSSKPAEAKAEDTGRRRRRRRPKSDGDAKAPEGAAAKQTPAAGGEPSVSGEGKRRRRRRRRKPRGETSGDGKKGGGDGTSSGGSSEGSS